jgi:benzoyl-CoA reductase/2-hydroxyglutaryl-CoA dehydratase subunit BcrC/BadD/HgdB
VNASHKTGFPRSVCTWIKGQYSVILENDFDAVIAVTTGDCSNTVAMTELLIDKGVQVFKFAYPIDNHTPTAYQELNAQIARLAEFLSVSPDKIAATFEELKPVRAKLKRLDELTVQGLVTGEENHIWLVSSSDFNSNVAQFEHELDLFLQRVEAREPQTHKVRLGYVGVPPIITDLYRFANGKGAGFYFNEVQRQFAMPSMGEEICETYLRYTYPYDIFGRVADIEREIEARHLDGIVHYVQAFCHRQIQDILLKRKLKVPVLTIEGDAPGVLDERSRIRLESFIEMIIERKR